MPLRTAVSDVLATWREAERLQGDLPPVSPDHETVALVIAECRATYQRLTMSESDTAPVLAASRSTLDHARCLLREVRARH